MQLLLALSGIAIIIAVVLSRTIGRTSMYYLKLSPSIFLILIGVILVGVSCMVNIKQDYVGIVKSGGALQPEALGSGWNLVSPIAEVIQMDGRIQSDTIYRTTSSENTVNNDTLSGFTVDGREVKMALSVTYLVNPNDAVNLYKETGLNFKQNIVQPVAHNLLIRDAKYYDSRSLTGDMWPEFKAHLNNDIKDEFKKHGLVVARISLTKFETAQPIAVATENISKPLSTLPPKAEVKPEAKPEVKPHIKPLAKKLPAPKKEVKPLATAKPKVSKPLPAPVQPAPVVKKAPSLGKVNIKPMLRPNRIARTEDQAAAVDTMYHHKLKEETANMRQNDTMYRSTVSQKAQDTVAAAIPTIPSPETTRTDSVVAAAAPTAVSPTPIPVADNSGIVPETTQPMDSAAFGSMKDFLRMHKTDDKKLAALKSISKINAFTSAQVLNIDNTLNTPESKLEFAKMAYPRTVDRKNYGIVAGSLGKKSRRSLDKYIMDFMAEKNTVASGDAASGNATSASSSTASKFVVPADCHILEDEKYTELRKRIIADNTADANQQFLKNTIENNCFTTEQVSGMLKLVHSKKTKLEMAKLAYARTVDRDRYSSVANSLSKRQKRALDKYIIRMMAVTIATKPAVVPIAGDTHDKVINTATENKPIDALLLKSLEAFTAEHFSDGSKMQVLTKILVSNYLTSAQVADITKLFGSAEAKLEFAKLAYKRTVDKGMYNLVITSLDDNSQKQLEEYIIGSFASR